jgi:hypothetical protein
MNSSNNQYGTIGTKSTRTFRYVLDKSSKKYECPKCKKKRFVRYVDTKKIKHYYHLIMEGVIGRLTVPII